jgi:phosphoglycolate phosphatase-like HAD superfamily hydrolase
MFDLDGTLIDTMFAFADLAAEMMARYHGAEPGQARARYLETSGIPFRQQLEVIHPGHDHNQRASDEFEDRKRAITAVTYMDERTIAGLERLRERGLELVVSSNTGQPFVDEFVAKETVAFDLALGYDAAAGLAKGAPHVERTCSALSVTPPDILFVGDSLKDGELAEATEVSFVGRVGTFEAQDFQRRFPGVRTIVEIDELLELF